MRSPSKRTSRLGLVFALAMSCSIPARAASIVLDSKGVQDVNNLRDIGLALINYESAFGSFPTDYFDSHGTALLSWRVALLPFFGEQALFNQFDLSKAWNDPVNFPLLQQMPAVYRSPASAAGSTDADYVGGVGANTMFPGAQHLKITSVTDGTSNTLFVGEAIGSSIPWTMPGDIAIGACPTLGGSGFSSFIAGGVPFVFVDGAVRFLPNDIDCAKLAGLFNRSDMLADTSDVITDVQVVPEPSLGLLVAAGAWFSAVRRRSIQRKKGM